ncbi:hypothetical protein CRG98_021357 [Punica granatum]|uniref:G-patch domain-containing protein n=1 Tax=Punica granatum TaxID=22663 RepID=A0A2I0JPQ3_PUNGR|nr:hypothetical protein CRG98_021357 [Punica granatum]
MAEGDHVDVSEEINPSAPTLSQPPQTHAPPPLTPTGVFPAYSGALPTHLPPPASSGAPLPPASPTSAATNDQARIATLEGTINQMATNMAELLALLSGPNRASSSSTPPPGPGPTVDPTPWAPPTQAPENVEAPAPPTLYTSTVHPFTTQLPPSPAPSGVPLPPTTFLSSEHVLSAPPPVSIPALAMAYSVPPPMVFPASTAPAPIHLQATELPPYPSLQPHAGLSYQAPPPINTTCHEPGMPTHAAQFASPTHFFPEADAEQERRLKRMEETIRALQVGDARPDARHGDGSLFPDMRLPSKFKIPEFKTYEGTTDPRHHLRHYRGKMLQYWEYEDKGDESSKKVPATSSSSSGRRGKEVTVNTVNTTQQAPQQYSMSYTAAPPVAPSYAPQAPQYRPQASTQPIYYSALPHPPLPAVSSPVVHRYAPAPSQAPQYQPPGPRTSQPTQRALPPQDQQGGAAQPRPRKQYPALPVPLSHIYWQIRDKVGTTTPSPSFDPTIQDQSKRCEYHQGAPGHTIDNYWKLREKIQEMIDAKELVFNAVRSPNVQANPLPDHGPAQGPSINAITVCTSSEGEDEQPYSDDRVPWTYEGGVRNLEQQFGVMGITHSGRLYENPVTTDKGKAPATEEEKRPRALPTPSKKVTEEEAEAFVKVIKASEYKVVEQMAKSPAHISLLALLLNSEPHREALMRVLTAAQEKIITVKGEEDYTIYKETAVPYISVGDDENLPFHSFETISVIMDYGEVGPSRADRMIGKVFLHHNYIPGIGLGARGQGINGPIEVEEYKHRRGLGFRPSCHEIIEARRGNHLHRLATHYGRLNRGIPVLPLSHFFPGPPLIIGSTSDGPSSDFDDTTDALPTVYAVIEEIPSGVHIRPAQINAGFLEVCNYSEWVANIVPVEKKDGRVRVCVDYRDLDKASPKDNFPLPHIDILVDNTARHAQFSFMDGFSGNNQIRMAEEDKIKTTFTTMWGTFCYRVMPFGLKNAGATYQRAMVTLFHDMMRKEVEVYVDDMIAKSKEGDDHLVNLKRLFDCLRDERGIEVDPDKVKAIKELPPPSSVREAYLVQPPVLVPPTPGRPLVLYLTVRRQSLGCMLEQEEESTHTERAIYYLSKKFTDGESNYPEIEKMCCALVWVMQRLRQYTLYHTVRLLSKADPLKYLLDSPSSTRNLAKWRCQLTEYDIEYLSRTSVKGQAIADHLAEFPTEDHTPINPDFPDERILRVDDEGEKPGWKMYFDGAVNSTGSGIGAVLISPDGHYYPVAAKIDFPCTNNVAEYEAYAKLVPYHEYLEKLTENFEDISFTYTPRMANQFADALATLASMVSITKENLIEPLEIEIAEGPAHCNSIEASEAKPWYEDIKNLLRTGQYPPFADCRDRKTLKRLAIHYFLSGEILYRRSFDSTLLRCIDEQESRRLMEEVHGGNCGPHMNGLMLAKKIMRLGYY